MARTALPRPSHGHKPSESDSSSSWIDFIIDNHADICVSTCLILFILYMVPATTFISAPFVTPQYNISGVAYASNGHPFPVVSYGTGPSDVSLTIFFVFLWISAHAIVYEFGLERLVKRYKLLNSQISVFYESAFLAIFYGFSFYWAFNIISDNGYLGSLAALTEDFPHKYMNMSTKLFLLSSLAYWLHAIPELMLLQVPEKHWNRRIVKYLINAGFVLFAYYFHYSRVAVCLLAAHYFTEFFFEASRFLNLVNFGDYSRIGFKIWGFSFAFTRVLIALLTVNVFWTSSAAAPAETPEGEEPAESEAEAETDVVRYIYGAVLLLVQAYLTLQFIKHISVHPNGLASLFAKSPKKSSGNKESSSSSGSKDTSAHKKVDNKKKPATGAKDKPAKKEAVKSQ